MDRQDLSAARAWLQRAKEVGRWADGPAIASAILTPNWGLIHVWLDSGMVYGMVGVNWVFPPQEHFQCLRTLRDSLVNTFWDTPSQAINQGLLGGDRLER